MKQRFLVSLLVGGLVATMLPGLAAAAHKGDSVTGAGTTEGNPDHGDWLHFTVSAHSGPNGENPRGNIVYRFLNPDNVIQLDPEKVRSADVVCLHVDGNEAVLVAEFAKDALPAGEVERVISELDSLIKKKEPLVKRVFVEPEARTS